MIVSRCSSLLRTAAFGIKGKQIVPCSRKSHDWYYRIGVQPPKSSFYVAELVGGFMWWWILWHFWTEPGHVFGEFEYPDASKWTNEELGIPEDDDELGLVSSE